MPVHARSSPVHQSDDDDNSSAEERAGEQFSGVDSDSDSLDSQGSRKRRKISPAPITDDSDDEDEPRIAISSVPSRISKKSAPAKVVVPPPTAGTILAPTDPNTSFAALDVKPWLVGSLNSMAIRRPTGIQKGCIPEILKGRDCIGGSRTGSGKTVAFAVPILQKWAEDPFGIFALILTPTRYVDYGCAKVYLCNTRTPTANVCLANDHIENLPCKFSNR